MTFPAAVDFVLKWEGGYTNDPNDPGGETHWGISKRSYPMLDIKNLSRNGAITIYRQDYWEPIGADALDPPMALCAFDAAVNCGVGRSAKWLAECNGDWREFLFLRMKHYVGLKSRLYLGGWMNRTLDCWNEARKLLG